MTRNRIALRRTARFAVEQLEDRSVPAALTFVNDNWAFVTDTDTSGSLTQGDIVSNLNDTINAGGVTAAYGVDAFGTVTSGAFTGSLAAFDTITEAIAATDPGGTVNVLQGAYTESVTVPTGITLTGNGTITGTVTISSGGTVDAGGVGTAGTLNATNLTVAAGGTVATDLNGTTAGTFDQLTVTTAVDVTGATLDVNTGAAIPVGTTLVIINNTGSGAVTGTFAGLAEGATVTASNGQQFTISYVGGTGNDVTLTALTAQSADLSITKTDNLKFVFNGGQTTYTIVVTNNGSTTVTGAQVTDNLSSELTNATWTSVSSGGATGSAGSGTGSINETVTLPPGASITYTVTATVTTAARGGLTNTATVSAPSGATDTNTANNTASDRDTVLPKAVPAFLHQFVVAGANGLVSVFNSDGSLRAQAPPFGHIGYFGPVRLAVGDLTGDGVEDFVFTVAQGRFSGLVEVVDGATLTLLGAFFPLPGFNGGLNVAIGDVNGDGSNDLVLATAFGASHVQAFDIATGTLLANFIAFPGFTGGLTLAVADVDGVLNANGLPTAEIIVGTATGADIVAVFNAAGQLLDSFTAYPFPYSGGVNVAAGDILGNDGKAEILVAPAGPGTNGLVELFQFQNHTPIATANLPFPGPDRGINVAIRDVDGDGDLDLIFAATPGRGSRVWAFSPSRGAFILNFDAFPGVIGGVEVG